MHGGRIFAESIEAGGTRITAILPRGPRPVQDETQGRPAGADEPSRADGIPPREP